MINLHILSCPYSAVNYNNKTDAFSIATWKFIKNITALGWNCIHYSIPGTDVPCEMIPCIDKISDKKEENIQNYNKKAAIEIAKRKSKDDIILCFYGIENRQAAIANMDCKIIEPHIGYHPDAVFAPYRVFSSYAQMHYYYGKHNMLLNPSWFDDVIYNSISEEEFIFSLEKEKYFLYFGRINESKGIHIAIQATQAAGKKLIIAGPGNLESLDYEKVPSHVRLLGTCDSTQRKYLMAKAQAIILPSYYLEPFGNVIAEGYMSGTPAITSDWGGFSENVIHGETGYRCKEFKEFVMAIHNINQIDPYKCKNWAMKNCEDSIVHAKYDRYLRKVIDGNFYR